MNNSRRTSSQFVKVAFASIAVIATGMTLSQLKLVRRVLSPIDKEAERNIDLPQNSLSDGSTVPASSSSFSSPRATKRKANWTRASFKIHPEFSEELMDEFISGAKELAAYKQKQRKQLLQKKREKDKKKKKQKDKTTKLTKRAKLKVPTPIFVPSLPKSGTTSTHQYFQCGGYKSAHLAARNGDDIFKIGRCAQRNVMDDRAPFAGCGDYDVWTDTGYVAARYQPDGRELRKKNLQCYYPLIEALDQVYESYPNSTFLFVVRETEAWLKSVQSYHEGFIMEVWKRCRTQGFPGLDAMVEDFRDFYEWHKEMIRNYALEHPSLTYIEVDLESPDAGQQLQDQVGIDASCWGHYNKGADDSAPTGSDGQLEESTEE